MQNDIVIFDAKETLMQNSGGDCIRCIYSYADKDGKYVGDVIFDLYAQAAFVHMDLHKHTPTGMKQLRQACYDVGLPLLKDEWDYDAIHFWTDSERMVKHISNGNATVIDIVQGRPLYRMEI